MKTHEQLVNAVNTSSGTGPVGAGPQGMGDTSRRHGGEALRGRKDHEEARGQGLLHEAHPRPRGVPRRLHSDAQGKGPTINDVRNEGKGRAKADVV